MAVKIRLYKDAQSNYRVLVEGNSKASVMPAGFAVLTPSADAEVVTISGFKGALSEVSGTYAIAEIADVNGVPYANYDDLVTAVGSFFRKPLAGRGGVTEPEQLTEDVNDFNPGSGETVYVNASTTVSITGIAKGFKGLRKRYINNGTFTITFPHEDVLSESINRIKTQTGANFGIAQNQVADFEYDIAILRWREI